MIRSKVATSVAAAALVGMLAAGCGSSSTSSSTTTAGGSGTTAGSVGTTSSATGTPIIVGNIGDYSGPQAGSIGGAEKVINAWADSVNAAGGIGGRPVKLIVKDDAANPTTALADVKELIADHVVAIVGDQSGSDTQWASAVAQAGVPVIGGLSIDLPFVDNPDFFPAGTNVIAVSYGMLMEAKSFGPKVGLLYCAEAPQCAGAVPLAKGLGAATGEQLAFAASVSATAPDYTAVCQSLKNSGAESYEIGSSSEVVQRIATACVQQGVTAKQVTVDGTVTASWTSTPALDGTLSAETDFPYVDDSVPATKAYQAALAKYAPDLGASNGPNASYAWVAGKLFEAAVAAIPSGSAVTPASVKAGLYTLKGDTLGGLAPPLTFTQGKPTAVNCYFTLGLSGGKVTEPKGLTTACAPDAVIGAVLSKLAG